MGQRLYKQLQSSFAFRKVYCAHVHQHLLVPSCLCSSTK